MSTSIKWTYYIIFDLEFELDQVSRLTPHQPNFVFVDRGYRGHDYEGDIGIHVDKERRGRTKKSLWKWMKSGHRLDRNRLRGQIGDQLNAILSAAGMNFSKLIRWLEEFLFFYANWRWNRRPVVNF